MSKYFIKGDTLTDIADAIRLKRDTVDEINPEDMPLAISLIDGGGGGGLWWQYPGTAELIGEVTKTVNLAADTSWNNITPSTTNQTILALQNTAADRFTYPFNLNDNDYVVIAEAFSDVKYKSGSAPQKPYATGAGYVNITSFGMRRVGSANHATPLTFAIAARITAAGTHDAGTQTAYGIGSPLATPALANTYATPGYITLGRGAVTVRGNTTYATVESLQDVDAAATNIYYRWRIYRMDKSTPSAIGVRAMHMAINHTFMED